MSALQNRLMVTAERLGFQASGLFAAKSYRQSEILALNALGIFMFLVVDQDTPDDMRERAEVMARVETNAAAKARSEWLKTRQGPKLQGKEPTIHDPELDEALEAAEYIMRSVAEELK
jgi:hypothetical protein